MKTFATVAAIAALVVTLAIIGSTADEGARDGSGRGVGVEGRGLDHMFAEHDANKDGKLSKDEFPGPDGIFDKIDADGDGFISEEEGKAAADAGMRMRKNMGAGGGRGGDPAQRWAMLLEHADADKDGKVSKDEFRGPDAAFDRLDANADGFISEDEAKAAGERIRRARDADPAQRWAMLLEHADADKDGKISKDEFKGPDAAFDRLDANADGFITEDEAKALGDRMREGAGQRGFARMDEDGDGNVTQDEWNAAFDKLDTNGDGVLNKEDRPERGARMGQGRGQGAGQGQGNGPNA